MEKRKVVISMCHGGFGLSKEASDQYYGLKGEYIQQWDIVRHDPILVEVVERLGEKADGDYANLVVIEVEGRYRIDEYDGYESLIEEHEQQWY